jgi:hypothetical protein
MIYTLAHVYGPRPAGGSWLDADDAEILTALDVLAEIHDRPAGGDV